MFKMMNDSVRVWSSTESFVALPNIPKTCVRRCEECNSWISINSCSNSIVRCSRHQMNIPLDNKNGINYRTATCSRRTTVSRRTSDDTLRGRKKSSS